MNEACRAHVTRPLTAILVKQRRFVLLTFLSPGLLSSDRVRLQIALSVRNVNIRKKSLRCTFIQLNLNWEWNNCTDFFFFVVCIPVLSFASWRNLVLANYSKLFSSILPWGIQKCEIGILEIEKKILREYKYTFRNCEACKVSRSSK